MTFLKVGTACAAVVTLALTTMSVDAQSSQSNGLFGQKDPNKVLDDRYKQANNRNQAETTKPRKKTGTRTRSTRIPRGSF